MATKFELQYEDVASTKDWRVEGAEILPQYMAISSDSHVVEPPEAYSTYIDPAYRDVAPRIVPNPDPAIKNELYHVEGMSAFPFHTSSSAGLKPNEIDMEKGGFSSVHKAGWDSRYRLDAQDRDGVLAEVLYPSVGMIICSHPDGDYKQACFRAYNQWIRDYCAEAPDRLFGIGQSAARSPEDLIEDLHQIKDLGLRGVMLPSDPSGDVDYDHADYDKAWTCAVELGLPLSFHILTGRNAKDLTLAPPRGGKIAGFGSIMRELQNVAGMFIFGRVFERHPDLRVVLVESDAGWIPHFCSRMDHSYKRHRFWMKAEEMQKLPSEYFFEHIYATFQDDWVALQSIDLVNPRRIMWANDYPHSDSTWPWSHELFSHHMAHLTKEQINWVLRDNVNELYELGVDTSAAEKALAAI